VAEEAGCEHPEPRYAGRPTAASTATGWLERHKQEQAALLNDALAVGKRGRARLASRKAPKPDA
jgi:2-oxoglutarate dehydrogenase E1 component